MLTITFHMLAAAAAPPAPPTDPAVYYVALIGVGGMIAVVIINGVIGHYRNKSEIERSRIEHQRQLSLESRRTKTQRLYDAYTGFLTAMRALQDHKMKFVQVKQREIEGTLDEKRANDHRDILEARTLAFHDSVNQSHVALMLIETMDIHRTAIEKFIKEQPADLPRNAATTEIWSSKVNEVIRQIAAYGKSLNTFMKSLADSGRFDIAPDIQS